ncbi:MAG: sugar transferase [Qipengyuania citrea]|jgi:lipopolysaccharide/colanic/teichoic acid biosynthesis glycosyltransferase|uniref:sugar transferase n=1 Tax=Alphaproteobacteria TaxID=28211 RepID=UPI003266D68B
MSSKRFLDVTASLAGLMVLWPLLAVVALAIRLESPGRAFFLQERVGRYGRRFQIVKLRTMRAAGPGSTRQITVGADARITTLGHFLRKTKLDELPQLVNVLKGEMSLVGPRPEVPAYIDRYTPEQRAIILSVRPGITDFAAIEFSDEADILARAQDPEAAYIEQVMPMKFKLYERYVREQSLRLDLKLILLTLIKITK